MCVLICALYNPCMGKKHIYKRTASVCVCVSKIRLTQTAYESRSPVRVQISGVSDRDIVLARYCGIREIPTFDRVFHHCGVRVYSVHACMRVCAVCVDMCTYSVQWSTIHHCSNMSIAFIYACCM